MQARAEALSRSISTYAAGLSAEPDSITFMGLLNVCTSVVALDEDRCSRIIQSGCDSNVFVGGGLVDIYAKCGSTCLIVFNKMPSGSMVSWNAISGGCDMNGLLWKLLNITDGCVKKDDITFVCQLVGFAGLVDEGVHCYASMITVYMISAKRENDLAWSTL